MSDSLHPHWQSTDETTPSHERNHVPIVAEEQVEVSSQPTEPVAPNSPAPLANASISRQLAALIGILIAVLVGLGFYYGVDHLTGQLVQGAELRLTESGIDPTTITVQQGQELIVTNETSRQQSLMAADWPCSDPESCLPDLIIAPGSTTRISIDEEIAIGSYSIALASDESLQGTIIVDQNLSVPEGDFSQATILLTENGPEPYEAVLEQGGTLTFINQTDSSNIIEFSSSKLNITTPVLLPEESYSITVSQDIETNTYSYTQGESDSGLLVVVPQGTTTGNRAAPLASDTEFRTDTSGTANKPGPTTQGQNQNTLMAPQTEESEVDRPSSGSIPQNPYAAGGAQPLHAGAPLRTPYETQPVASVQSRPQSQPQTGAGTWLLGLSLVAALGTVLRKAQLRQSTVTLENPNQ